MTEPKKSKLLLPILLALLAAVGAFTVIENQKRAAVQAAYDGLVAKMDSSVDTGEAIDSDAVHAFLGREPDRVRQEPEKVYIEEYDFKTLTRTQTLHCQYVKAAAALLNSVKVE